MRDELDIAGEVLTAFEVAVNSPANDTNDIPHSFLAKVIGFAWIGWDVDQMSKVLDVYVDSAPTKDLERMAADAKSWLAWHAKFLADIEEERSELERWNRAGREIKRVDPDRYQRMLEIIELQVEVVSPPLEGDRDA